MKNSTIVYYFTECEFRFGLNRYNRMEEKLDKYVVKFDASKPEMIAKFWNAIPESKRAQIIKQLDSEGNN